MVSERLLDAAEVTLTDSSSSGAAFQDALSLFLHSEGFEKRPMVAQSGISDPSLGHI